MASTIESYRARRKRMVEHLGGVCSVCGTSSDLQFDHIDHNAKGFDVSKAWSNSWQSLVTELQKCQLLCKEHHLEKSRREGSLAKGWTNEFHSKHGTVWMYSGHGCRCDPCKAAKSGSMKAQYARKALAG